MTKVPKDWTKPATYQDDGGPQMFFVFDPGVTEDAESEEDNDLEVLLLSSFPNNDMTTVTFSHEDDGQVFIEQLAGDGSLDCLMLNRDMVVEMIGVLNTFVRATAK